MYKTSVPALTRIGVCCKTIVALSLCAGLLPATDVTVHLSSKAGDRIALKGRIAMQSAASAGPATFRIDDKTNLQRIDGFGATFLEAGMMCVRALDQPQQDALLAALFDPAKGAGFSAMKTTIAGTDFQAAGGWYTYDDTPGDVSLKNFSIARDLAPNGSVSFIKAARRYGKFVLQAPMDYPPDWMLVDVAKNQDVDSKYYDALAHYYLRYVQEYEKQGIHIDYVSLFNEPGVYTKIPYAEIRDLLKNHVGPLFAQAGVKTRLQLSEAPDRANAVANYPIILDDPEARKYVASAPYHGYGFKDFDKLAALIKRYPGLPFWMTEICWAYGAGAPKDVKLPRYDWEDGDFWADQIFGDIEAGASAWLYWNMILDETGGPWMTSEIHGDPDPNVQQPIVVVNRQTKKVDYMAVYYYLAHFSKFVRPGAVRVALSGNEDKIRALAFRVPEGGLVLQLLNRRDTPATVTVAWRDQVLKAELPALSIGTYQWNGK
jgi:glucosylceramidase